MSSCFLPPQTHMLWIGVENPIGGVFLYGTNGFDTSFNAMDFKHRQIFCDLVNLPVECAENPRGWIQVSNKLQDQFGGENKYKPGICAFVFIIRNEMFQVTNINHYLEPTSIGPYVHIINRQTPQNVYKIVFWEKNHKCVIFVSIW